MLISTNIGKQKSKQKIFHRASGEKKDFLRQLLPEAILPYSGSGRFPVLCSSLPATFPAKKHPSPLSPGK